MAWLRFEEEMHISIHALRKESDSSTSSSMTANHNIIVLQGKIGIFCHHKQRV